MGERPPRAPRRRVDGVLLLDKPAGLSSNAALQRARRLYAAEKAGHTGTLDPLASGLLPICFGEATKFAQFLLDAEKRYRATVRFGAATSTGDAEGEVVATAPVAFDRAALLRALASFVGTISQVPPRHAALKRDGRPYYAYARAGIEIDRPPREVEIRRLTLVDWSAPDAVVDVACSKGTYVRTLAEDLGRSLGSAAHLVALRRTGTGGFRLDDAIALATLEVLTGAERDDRLLAPAVLVEALVPLRIGPEEAARFLQGRAVAAPGLADGPCAVFEGTALLGVAGVAAGLAQPRRVRAASS